MSSTIEFIFDGKEIKGAPGQSILEAAQQAGVYIPRLCYMKGLVPHGSCRVCTVLVNGRPQSACTQPIAPGVVIENDTEKVKDLRKNIIEMLFDSTHDASQGQNSGDKSRVADLVQGSCGQPVHRNVEIAWRVGAKEIAPWVRRSGRRDVPKQGIYSV